MDISIRKPNMRNRADEAIKEETLCLSFKYPAYGQVRIKNELAKKGMKVSPCGVHCVWQFFKSKREDHVCSFIVGEGVFKQDFRLE